MGSRDDSSRVQSGPILVGLVFIFLGLALLTDRAGWSGIHVSGRYWPLLLILYGWVGLLTPIHDRGKRPRSRWTAAWFVFLGLWFLVNEFRVFGLWYDTSWPLLAVWAGVRMTSCAIGNAYRPPTARIEGS